MKDKGISGVIEAAKIVVSLKTGEWCLRQYPGHPKGCPNYNKKDGCPPNASFITEIMDLKKPVYIAFSEFNLSEHVERMRSKHPTWTDRQLKNVLYWQNTSRSQMRRARIARVRNGADLILICPEAHGVNVYATCFCSGLRLQKIKNLVICRHVALIGFSLDRKEEYARGTRVKTKVQADQF